MLSIFIFTDFLKSRGYDEEFENKDASELGILLREFYCCVRQKPGKEDEPGNEYSRSA